MPVLLSDIINHLMLDLIEVIGFDNGAVNDLVALDVVDTSDSITFCSFDGHEGAKRIRSSGAKFVICTPSAASAVGSKVGGKLLITVANPRLAFIRTAQLFAPDCRSVGIDSTAVIHPECKVGENVYIGRHTTLQSECSVGDGSYIDSMVQIYRRVQIGKRVNITSGAVIGAVGFGFERDERGHLHRFPHVGRVVIGDDVEIGANTCINCGGLGDTVIGDGTKIDDLSYIAHNVRVGRNCLIMASSVICGSAVIGDGVEICPGAVVRDKHTIGDGARIGLGAVVVEDVAAGAIVAGVPAKPLRAATNSR